MPLNRTLNLGAPRPSMVSNTCGATRASFGEIVHQPCDKATVGYGRRDPGQAATGRAAPRLRQPGRERLDCDPELGKPEIAAQRFADVARGEIKASGWAIGSSCTPSPKAALTRAIEAPGCRRKFRPHASFHAQNGPSERMPEPNVLAIATLSLFGSICGQFCDRKRRRNSVDEVKKSL